MSCLYCICPAILVIFQYALATLEELEKEAQSTEKKLGQETERGAAVDRQTLAASLTSCRTRIVTLNTQALASKGRLEGYMAERKKRVLEIKRYQALLVDLEAWLGEAQSTISSEIKLTSAKVVRDQIRASQVRMLLGCFITEPVSGFKRPLLTFETQKTKQIGSKNPF